MSLSYPTTYDSGGLLIDNGNFSAPIPLKNYSNLEDSYILTYGKDPVNSSEKWLMMKYNGQTSNGYQKNSSENSSFNTKITYNAFNSSYSPQ
jgi:hypothetical protein